MPTATRNPITQAELAHLKYHRPRWLRSERRIVVGILILIVLAVILSYEGRSSPTFPLELWIIWGVRALVALRATLAGVNVISREYTGQTWDSLVLTGLNARQILIGKWRAVVQRVLPWGILLVLVWYAMTVALVVKFPQDFPGVSPPNSVPLWVPWLLIIAIVSVPLLAALEILSSTLIGIAASALTRRGIAASVLAVSIRLLPVIVLFFITVSRFEAEPDWLNLLSTTDGGIAVTILYMLPVPDTQTVHQAQYLVGLIGAALLLIVLLGAAWLIALKAMRHGGALTFRARAKSR